MDRRDSGEESTGGMMHLGSSSLSHARSSHDTEHSVPCRDEEIERLRAENAMLRESLVQYKVPCSVCLSVILLSCGKDSYLAFSAFDVLVFVYRGHV